MDFSNLLKKEIDLKRKKAKSTLSLKRKRLAEKNHSESASLEKNDDFKSDAQVPQMNSALPKKKQESSDKGSQDQGNSKEVPEKVEFDEVELPVKEDIVSVEPNPKSEKKAGYTEYLERENQVDIVIQSEDILNQNTEKLSLQIRKFFKEMLYTWTDHCNEQFPSAVLLETKRDVVKLLYKLRSGKLDAEVVISLATIVHYIQTEHFIRASESYLKLSIGNVAWPIGVRDVGIHARAADAKIAGDDKQKLANIMKSESTRRWLVAVKRLINYSESLHKKK